MSEVLRRELAWWRERHAYWLAHPPKRRWFRQGHNTMAQHAAEQVAQLELRLKEGSDKHADVPQQ